jgi:MoxR-like ATPase
MKNPSTQSTSSNRPAITLTDGQREGLFRLRAFYAMKKTAGYVAGIDSRPIPLIVGPSGSGKSTLVRHFVESQKLPMMDFCSGTWLTSGSRGTPPTLTAIRQFVEEVDAGVLFIDELDKFSADQDYYRSIQQEVYALLDGRLSSFEGWTADIQKKFHRNFFIIGAGTWQHLFKTAEGRIDLDNQDSIPDELLMRFNARAIVLDPPSARDFRERFTAIHQELKVPLPSSERMKRLITRAVASRKNNRVLEAYLSYILERQYRGAMA